MLTSCFVFRFVADNSPSGDMTEGLFAMADAWLADVEHDRETRVDMIEHILAGGHLYSPEEDSKIQALLAMLATDSSQTRRARQLKHGATVESSWTRLDEDGVLLIQIINGGFSETPSEQTRKFFANGSSLIFQADGFEVLWQAASFETNFLRAFVIDWIKLAFLGMLGVSAATFLSFPVAILLAFTVFVGGSMTPFISESVNQFRADEDAIAFIRFAQTAIAGVASSVEWLLRPFGQASPNRLVIEGRLVSIDAVLGNLLVIGIFWCGFALAIGWGVFRRRELATYSGHG